MRIRRLVSALLPSVLIVATAAAQKPDVPSELVTALTTAGGFGASGLPDVVVGTVPSGTTDKLRLPRGATILGSASRERTTVVIVTYPAGGDTILKAFQTALAGAGWVDQFATSPLVGFVSQQTMDARRATMRVNLCHKDGWSLFASIVRQLPQQTTVSLRLTAYTLSAAPFCAVANYGPRTALPGVIIPPVNPTDQASLQSCYSGAGAGMNSSTNYVRTLRTPDELIDAFVKQLSDSGWTMEMTLAPPIVIASRTLVRKDSTGAEVKVRISVAAQARDSLCRTMTMELQPGRQP